MKTQVCLWIIAITLMLAACSKTGNEYLGTWQNVNDEKETIEIKSNEGDTFIIAHTAPSFWTGDMKTLQYPALYKDNILQVQQGVLSFSLFIDQSTGLLSDGKNQYTKITIIK